MLELISCSVFQAELVSADQYRTEVVVLQQHLEHSGLCQEGGHCIFSTIPITVQGPRKTTYYLELHQSSLCWLAFKDVLPCSSRTQYKKVQLTTTAAILMYFGRKGTTCSITLSTGLKLFQSHEKKSCKHMTASCTMTSTRDSADESSRETTTPFQVNC